jgi:hypothetical protein
MRRMVATCSCRLPLALLFSLAACASRNADRYGHDGADAYADPDGYGNAHCHADGHEYADKYSDGDHHTDGHQHAHEYGDRDRKPHLTFPLSFAFFSLTTALSIRYQSVTALPQRRESTIA